MLNDCGLYFHDRLNNLLKLVSCFFLHACDDVILFQYPRDELVDIVEGPCEAAFKVGLSHSFEVIKLNKGKYAALVQVLEQLILRHRDALTLELINHLTILILFN